MSEWTIWRDCLTGCPFGVPEPRRSSFQPPFFPFLSFWGCDTNPQCALAVAGVPRSNWQTGRVGKCGCSSRLRVHL